MHAACISSYGHHSPMLDFWCQEKVKKLKLWKKKLKKKVFFFPSTFSYPCNLLFLSSSIIKQSITKSFPHLSHHYHLFRSAKKVLHSSAPLRIYYSLFEEWATHLPGAPLTFALSLSLTYSYVNFKAYNFVPCVNE